MGVSSRTWQTIPSTGPWSRRSTVWAMSWAKKPLLNSWMATASSGSCVKLGSISHKVMALPSQGPSDRACASPSPANCSDPPHIDIEGGRGNLRGIFFARILSVRNEYVSYVPDLKCRRQIYQSVRFDLMSRARHRRKRQGVEAFCGCCSIKWRKKYGFNERRIVPAVGRFAQRVSKTLLERTPGRRLV